MGAITLLAACGGGGEGATAGSASTPNAGPHNLVGLFRLTDGKCSTSQTEPPTGSYFAMLSGKSLAGPFVANGTAADASGAKCPNQSSTPLLAGSDGGLKTGNYQPNPTSAFDSSGNGLAGLIAKPASFFGTDFALSTNATDPQSTTSVATPKIMDTGGKLSGDLSALNVAWNTGYYNQGAPKPDGTYPGVTTALSGTIACDGGFTMIWASTIVGGAFNNFTGSWHFTGTFVPASGSLSQALGC
ncbi:MAG: hypothetical protein JOZ75_10525 [Candidatus Dormibacteraeota bacterium]|nr:hypothetical protein [Candidatus Dormibacteraeota bacterium]